MPGSTPDLSNYSLGQEYAGTFSSTVNECEVIEGYTKLPSMTRYLAIYSVNDARLGDGSKNHAAKTASSTLIDSEAHKPIPAKTWVHVEYSGARLLLSCATASGGYTLVPLLKKP